MKIRYVDPSTNRPVYRGVPPEDMSVGNIPDMDDSSDFSDDDG